MLNPLKAWQRRLCKGTLLILVCLFARHASGESDYYKLRGVLHLDREWLFSLSTENASNALWAKIGQNPYGIFVIGFDESTQRLRLSIHGQETELQLENKLEIPVELIVSEATSLHSRNERYREAVRIAATFLIQTPRADILDAPIDETYRRVLEESRNEIAARTSSPIGPTDNTETRVDPNQLDLFNTFQWDVQLELRHQIQLKIAEANPTVIPVVEQAWENGQR